MKEKNRRKVKNFNDFNENLGKYTVPGHKLVVVGEATLPFGHPSTGGE